MKILDYVKSIILDNGEHFINSHEILEVLVGAGSFTDMSLFDKECLEHIPMIELQKSLSKQGIYVIYFFYSWTFNNSSF